MKKPRVDDLQLAVRFSCRGKTLQITVERDGRLIIPAPTDTDASRLTDFVREK